MKSLAVISSIFVNVAFATAAQHELLQEEYEVIQVENGANSEVRVESGERRKLREIANLQAKLASAEKIVKVKNRDFQDSIIVTTRANTLGYADPGSYEFVVIQNEKEVYRKKGKSSVPNTPSGDEYWWDIVVLNLPVKLTTTTRLVIVRTIVTSERDVFTIRKLTEEERIAKRLQKARTAVWSTTGYGIAVGEFVSWQGRQITIKQRDSTLRYADICELDEKSRRLVMLFDPDQDQILASIQRLIDRTKTRRWRDTNRKVIANRAKLVALGNNMQITLEKSDGTKQNVKFSMLGKPAQKFVETLAKKILKAQEKTNRILYDFRQNKNKSPKFHEHPISQSR